MFLFCFCFVFCFVFVGFGGPGGGFGAPGGGFFSTGSSSALRYFYLYQNHPQEHQTTTRTTKTNKNKTKTRFRSTRGGSGVVLARKFLVESEFQGQEPPRTQETSKTTSTIRIPRVGFGTDRPYIALFLGPTFRGANCPRWTVGRLGPGSDLNSVFVLFLFCFLFCFCWFWWSWWWFWCSWGWFFF